MDQMVEAN